MSEKQILSMLEEGHITSDEAARLLEAVSSGPRPSDAERVDRSGEPDAPHGEPVEPSQVTPGTLSPSAQQWKRLQLIPLAVSLVVLIVTAWGLWAVYRAADARITFGWVVLLILFLVALAATTLSVWITRAPWLHVRIHEQAGKTIAISFPIPLTLAGLGIRIARRYVDEQTAQYLDASAEFVRVMRREHGRSEPIEISVDEEGQRVQVYFG
jgi:hypothetical protein